MSDTPDFTPAPIPTEAELASFDHRNIPSSVEVIGDVRINAEPVLNGLSPEMRSRINAKMTGVKADHDIFERQFIREELEANSHRVKVLSGIHKDANEYEKVSFGIVREIYHLEKQAERIEAELADVAGYRTEHDEDGNPQAVPILRYQQDSRKGREAALADLRRQVRLLEGHEGAHLRSEAAKAVQARIADQNARLQEDREVRQLADEMIRRERVEAAAGKRAANRRHEMR